MLESSPKVQVGPLSPQGHWAGGRVRGVPILLWLVPAHSLGVTAPQGVRASEANHWLSPHRLVWTSRTSPEAHTVPLCFYLGAGAFAGIPGECPISLAHPTLPSQTCSSQPWSSCARRCSRASQATHSPLLGCPRALPSRKDLWQPGCGLQVRVCCWLCRTGRFWRSAARCPSGVSHQSS